jgi:hypothetical protein
MPSRKSRPGIPVDAGISPQHPPADRAEKTTQSAVSRHTAVVFTPVEGLVAGPGNVGVLCRRALLAYGQAAFPIVVEISTCVRYSAPQRDEIHRVGKEMSQFGIGTSLPQTLVEAFVAAVDCENEYLSGLAGETLGQIDPRATDILVNLALQSRRDPQRLLRFLRAAERTGKRPDSVTLKLQLFTLSVPAYPEIRQVAQRLACVRPLPDYIDTSLIDPFAGPGWPVG